MDNSPHSAMNSSFRLGTGKRGCSWTQKETRALLQIWGEAEMKHAVSTLKRNYQIFAEISSKLAKLGFRRGPVECRTKTKALRKLYKQALMNDNRSGTGRTDFVWFSEMQRIFRGDPSFEPFRATESEAPSQKDVNYHDSETCTLELDDASEACSPKTTDQGNLDEDMEEGAGCENGLPTENDNLREYEPYHHNAAARDSCETEDTLEPSSRLAVLRRRKQRASAAAKLDDTLSKYMEWVQFESRKMYHVISRAQTEQIAAMKNLSRSLEAAVSTVRQASDIMLKIYSNSVVDNQELNVPTENDTPVEEVQNVNVWCNNLHITGHSNQKKNAPHSLFPNNPVTTDETKHCLGSPQKLGSSMNITPEKCNTTLGDLGNGTCSASEQNLNNSISLLIPSDNTKTSSSDQKPIISQTSASAVN